MLKKLIFLVIAFILVCASFSQRILAEEDMSSEKIRLGSFVLVGLETNLDEVSAKPEWFKEYYKGYEEWQKLPGNNFKKLAIYAKDHPLMITKEQAKEIKILYSDDLVPLMFTPDELTDVFHDFSGIEYLSNLEKVGIDEDIYHMGTDYKNGINSYPFSREQIDSYYQRLVEGFKRVDADTLWPKLNKDTLRSDSSWPYDRYLRTVTKEKIENKANDAINKIDASTLSPEDKKKLKDQVDIKLAEKVKEIDILNAYDLSTSSFESKIEKDAAKEFAEIEKEIKKLEKINISVSKVWSDSSSVDKEVTIKLVKKNATNDSDITVTDENNQPLTLVLNSQNGYKGVFENISKYENDGETLIKYSIYEVKVDGYISTVTGNQENGFVVTNSREQLEVTFMNEDSEYSKVNVEKGFSIDGDSLANDSMPQNPNKQGYKFKGWNIKADGSGEAFTGDTKVVENMVVYAVYEKDKEPIISTTPKPEIVKVTFMNEDSEYSKVNVEKGFSIDGDSLSNNSMPQNPNKHGYQFKEWNTKADGSGDVFTGETVVSENVAVYAVYTKMENLISINEAPILAVKDKTIEYGDSLDFLSLVVNAKDKEDGDLTKDVKIIDDGGFSKTKLGKYIITFKLSDKDGASVIKKASVTVVAPKMPTSDNSLNTNLNFDNNTSQAPSLKTLPKTGVNTNSSSYVSLAGLSALLLIILKLSAGRKEN